MLLEYSSGGISVTILKKTSKVNEFSIKELNTRQIKALEFLRKNNRITNKVYQELCTVSRKTATRDLRKLIKLGYIKTEGLKGAGSVYEII